MSFETDVDVSATGEGLSQGLAYAVKLEVFEGPLDLLLHLIRLNEVDVTDIPISQIAGQYIEYLALMRELNLDVAGEYLLMAATLAWIKSRMILPPTEEEAEEEGFDPRAELVARLLEYQRFKEVSDQLGEVALLNRDVYAASHPELDPTPENEREIAVDLVRLVEAFRRVLTKAKVDGHIHEVEAETVTVRERMIAIMDVMADAEQLEFEQIFERSGGPPSRPVLVTSFLALLELVRLAAVRVYQGIDDESVPEGPIHLRRVDDGDVSWSERVAEIM